MARSKVRNEKTARSRTIRFRALLRTFITCGRYSSPSKVAPTSGKTCRDTISSNTISEKALESHTKLDQTDNVSSTKAAPITVQAERKSIFNNVDIVLYLAKYHLAMVDTCALALVSKELYSLLRSFPAALKQPDLRPLKLEMLARLDGWYPSGYLCETHGCYHSWPKADFGWGNDTKPKWRGPWTSRTCHSPFQGDIPVGHGLKLHGPHIVLVKRYLHHNRNSGYGLPLSSLRGAWNVTIEQKEWRLMVDADLTSTGNLMLQVNWEHRKVPTWPSALDLVSAGPAASGGAIPFLCWCPEQRPHIRSMPSPVFTYEGIEAAVHQAQRMWGHSSENAKFEARRCAYCGSVAQVQVKSKDKRPFKLVRYVDLGPVSEYCSIPPAPAIVPHDVPLYAEIDAWAEIEVRREEMFRLAGETYKQASTSGESETRKKDEASNSKDEEDTEESESK